MIRIDGRLVVQGAADGTPLPVDETDLDLATDNGSPIVASADTLVVAAPAAGFCLKVYRLHASNGGSTVTKIAWRAGVAGELKFPATLPLYGIASLKLEGEWKLPAATALYLNTDAAGSIGWTVSYDVVPA